MSVFRISRFNIIRNGRHPSVLANFSSDSTKKDSPEDVTSTDKKAKDTEKSDKKEVTSKRLNDLLALMSTDTDVSIIQSVIKPRSAAEKKAKQKERTEQRVEEKPKSANIAEAAKKVAETFGGDTKKTESELLAILLKSTGEKSDQNVNTLIRDMKVDKNTSPPFERRSDVVRKSMAQKPFQRQDDNFQRREWTERSERPRRDENFQVREGTERFERPRRNDNFQMREGTERFERPRRDRREQQANTVRVSVDLFGGKPLGIFTNPAELQDSPDILSTWNNLYRRELKLAVTHPPKNYFEKMAVWTEQGKLWKFPIDNEQGMDEEAKNYFTEHVFLEKHLESWCPTKGPVRHFMELICVGLSKNPYFTVTQKKEHIEWFRDYFAAKKELLDSVIVHADASKELQ